MFMRNWSNLPADPHFLSDLERLGYFINKDDEVRSIEEPDRYFKYFINRNERWNERQRFAMNQALQSEVHTRLSILSLKKVILPLGTPPSAPHVPIFLSDDFASKDRIVLIFGDSTQDLGILAHRVVRGLGGVDAGSLVSAVRALTQQRSSPAADSEPPGILLANMGELLWRPADREGEIGRTLSRSAFAGAPMASAACAGNLVDERATAVPRNATRAEHVKYVFDEVLPWLKPEAGLDIVGLGDGADAVEEYFDCEAAWALWGPRVNCFAIVGGMLSVENLRCEGFKQFLRERARAYVPSTEPAGMTLSGPDGNPRTTTFTGHGCPVFSCGEEHHVECAFVAGPGQRAVLDWLQEVTDCGGASAPYRNPDVTVMYSDPVEDGPEPDWTEWTAQYAERMGGKGKEEAKSEDTSVVRVGSLSDSDSNGVHGGGN